MVTDKFDDILREGLRKHTEPTPPDFTETVLMQIKKAQDQKILARVVLQERLALAGCIILGIAIIAMTIFLAQTNADPTSHIQATFDKIAQTAQSFFSLWQLNFFMMALLGFTVYAIVDFLVSDT